MKALVWGVKMITLTCAFACRWLHPSPPTLVYSMYCAMPVSPTTDLPSFR